MEWLTGINLIQFGLMPRTLPGLLGIISSPFIHGGGFHLFSNTLPLIVLGIGLFYLYYQIAIEVFLWIYLTTGFWVWIIGRSAWHIGASGIIYGLMSFIFFSGIFRKNVRSLAISMAVFVLYGGMIYGIFPGDENISWESHLMGFLSGAFVAFFFRKEPIYVGDHSEIEDRAGDEQEMDDEIPHFSEPNNSADSSIHFFYDFKPSKKNK
jgi:membrane associated rhomboid family serine protease